MAQVKKLSVATVHGRVDIKAVVNSEKPLPVMKVIGQAVGLKTGQSNFGEWTALLGRFEAWNNDGEQFEASQLFLPEVALIPIRVALAAQGTRSVDFAIELFVKPTTNVKPGAAPYEYTFVDLAPPAESDPLQRLRSLALAGPSAPPALPNASDDSANDQVKPAAKKRA